MKRIISLVIYTFLVIGGSYIFQNTRYLSTILYIGIIIIGIGIVAVLNPSVSTTLNSKVDLHYSDTQKEMYSRLLEKKIKQNNIDYFSILMYLYLLVPFFISIALFV